jgi:signal transduction histidine kinase
LNNSAQLHQVPVVVWEDFDPAWGNSDLTAHISHQILSCAAKAQAIANILESDIFSEQLQPKLSQTLYLVVKDLERLGRKLIYLQKKPTAEILADSELIDLISLIDDTADPFQWQYPDRPIVKHHLTDIPLVWGNKELLQIVLDNLLSNAFKYSAPQTPVTITTEKCQRALEKYNGEIIISVTNLGSYIPLGEQEKIFNKFYRGNSPGQPGQGLGLYLSRRLIQMHGGQLAVESSPTDGTTFWFTIPLFGPQTANGFSHNS